MRTYLTVISAITHLLMDVNTLILLVEALVITSLSTYLWLGTQDQEEVTTLQWVMLFVLFLFLIGFAVTMTFNPLAMQ